jgi:hypothetical protein
MQTMLWNIRYAVRQLLRTPTFTIVTILTWAEFCHNKGPIIHRATLFAKSPSRNEAC